MISSVNFCFSVSIARSINDALSYVVTISTPLGRLLASCFSLALTFWITSLALSPILMTTTPPTTSPLPFSSATPLLSCGPVLILATL